MFLVTGCLYAIIARDSKAAVVNRLIVFLFKNAETVR
jgi:hypothetical protein